MRYIIILFFIFLTSCEKTPLFNIVGQKENSSKDFVIEKMLDLEKITRVGSVYGTPGASPGNPGTADNPPGAHNGIDICADEGTEFIACVNGVVVALREGHDNFGATKEVEIRYNSEYSIIYLFEPPKEIKVKLGEVVYKGDVIGYLGKRDVGACVHFGIKKNGEWRCPVPYLTKEVRKKLNDVYHKEWHPSDCPQNLCNHPEHQSLFE